MNLLTTKLISLEMAKRMADAAEQKASVMKIKIVIAILDAGRNLLYFRRMDGTSTGSIQVSQLKAYTSASFPLSTRDLAEKNSLMANSPYGGGAISGFVLLPGGLPIIAADGTHLGGIGISGSAPDQDEECALSALKSIAPYLN